MIDLEVMFSVVIGGTLTLLGTLLANWLQYRSEERKIKKARAKERLTEVRRYLTACMNFVDSVSIPTTMGLDNFGTGAAQEWLELMKDRLDEWKSLPVSGSARVLFVTDKEIVEGLKKIDQIRIMFFLNYRTIVHGGQVAQLDDKREELKEVTAKLSARLDKLLDKA